MESNCYGCMYRKFEGNTFDHEYQCRKHLFRICGEEEETKKFICDDYKPNKTMEYELKKEKVNFRKIK